MLKKILTLLFIAAVVIQFFPPDKNQNANATSYNNIRRTMPVPDSVEAIFQKSCYDCHSNNTDYPWYAEVQPISWWINHHVNEGKEEVNFDEFAAYSVRRRHRKLEEIIDQVKKDEMPLGSYTLIHNNTKLSSSEKQVITAWADAAMQKMKAQYPADSFIKK